MTELTELEIRKKIAAIEGLTFEVRIGEVFLLPWSRYGADKQYNPLTSKALLWDLMVKHEVMCDYSGSESGDCYIMNSGLVVDSFARFENKAGIPRAILECIIETSGK